MPIYEYRCSSCDFKFEELCRLNEADRPAQCPRCSSPAKRVLSTFACFSKDESGMTVPTGGSSSCTSCSSGSCSTCG